MKVHPKPQTKPANPPAPRGITAFARFGFVFVLCALFFSCNDCAPGSAIAIAPSADGDANGKSNGSAPKTARVPKLVSINIIDGTHITLVFSDSAVLRNVAVGAVQGGGDMLTEPFTEEIPCSAAPDESGTVHTIRLANATQNGVTYAIRGTVASADNSTLMFGSFFSGFNDNVPRMVLSEVQTEYSSSNKKCEYIELYIQSDGNLGGVCLYSASDGDDSTYEFPPIEVKAGEFVVVHFRKIEENCIDETGTDLSLSAGQNTSPAARDLWVDNQKARLAKTNVILLEERKNGTVLDALLLGESKKTDWPKAEYEYAAARAAACGAWLGGSGFESALISDRLTTTRTASRQGDLQTAQAGGKENWLVTATGTASPGKPNSDKPYIDK